MNAVKEILIQEINTLVLNVIKEVNFNSKAYDALFRYDTIQFAWIGLIDDLLNVILPVAQAGHINASVSSPKLEPADLKPWSFFLGQVMQTKKPVKLNDPLSNRAIGVYTDISDNLGSLYDPDAGKICLDLYNNKDFEF